MPPSPPLKPPPPPKLVFSEDEEDEDSELFLPPAGKRLAPVGGNAEEDSSDGRKKDDKKTTDKMESSSSVDNFDSFVDARMGSTVSASPDVSNAPGSPGEDAALKRRLARMEEEQEELNDSLMAMTSHFAKVRCSFF